MICFVRFIFILLIFLIPKKLFHLSFTDINTSLMMKFVKFVVTSSYNSFLFAILMFTTLEIWICDGANAAVKFEATNIVKRSKRCMLLMKGQLVLCMQLINSKITKNTTERLRKYLRSPNWRSWRAATERETVRRNLDSANFQDAMTRQPQTIVDRFEFRNATNFKRSERVL